MRAFGAVPWPLLTGHVINQLLLPHADDVIVGNDVAIGRDDETRALHLVFRAFDTATRRRASNRCRGASQFLQHCPVPVVGVSDEAGPDWRECASPIWPGLLMPRPTSSRASHTLLITITPGLFRSAISAPLSVFGASARTPVATTTAIVSKSSRAPGRVLPKPFSLHFAFGETLLCHETASSYPVGQMIVTSKTDIAAHCCHCFGRKGLHSTNGEDTGMHRGAEVDFRWAELYLK